MPTKTDKVRAKLAKNPNPDPDKIKEWSEEIGCSPSLVYKWIAKLPEESRQVKASEPVFTVEEEPETVEIEETEEGLGEDFDVPSFEEETEGEEEEEVERLVVTEVEGVVVEQEERLKEIAGRAIGRIFDVVFSDVLDLTKVGLSKQENEDTTFLGMLMISKYLKVEVTQYMLEFTSGLHFGSIGFRVLVAWLKKRKEEKKKEETKPVSLPEPEVKEPETVEEEASEQVALCSACKKQVVAEESEQGLCIQCQKKAENDFMKKFRK